MTTPADFSVTWRQALAWRLDRHLLDPVGSEPVADVVRRLGAVLSMDEALAEHAVRTRRTTSCSAEFRRALADTKPSAHEGAPIGQLVAMGVLIGTTEPQSPRKFRMAAAHASAA